MRRSFLAFTLGAFVLGFSGAASAKTWVCGLSDDATRLVCVADVEAQATADDAPAKPTAVVHGTRFPLDPAREWSVDFWSPATDLEHVALLAQATICYRSPGCQVVFARPQGRNLMASR
jgi:hypothetical protein